MDGTELDIRLLGRPAAFPHPTATVSVVETHISLVFLTETHVYKTKKPVRFPFLDYSTLERRLAACHDEIRVNRRLAPHVYLGVLPITRCGDTLCINGTGEVVDYCVEMIRLPEEQLLDHRIAEGLGSVRDIDRLIDVLVPFYKLNVSSLEQRQFASPSAITGAVRENVQTMEPLLPTVDTRILQRIRSSQWQYVAIHRETLLERIDAGAVVEGHGDLRPEHICMMDPPVVFDAVEFSESLRTADVVSELAFLAMECDFLGAHHLGRHLLESYQCRSGSHFPRHLFAFYQAYRATVRAKVHLLQAAQKGSEAVQHQTLFHRYLHLAAAYASDFHQPVMVLIMGASGVGKSTIARALVDLIGATWIRTDEVRHEIAGGRDRQSRLSEGSYRPEMTEQTYSEVLRRANENLRDGVSVVLDGTFIDSHQRDYVRQLGHRMGSPVVVAWCQCPDALARKRIEERNTRGDDISDARPDVFEHQIERLRAASNSEIESMLRLDTTRPLEELVETVRLALKQRLLTREEQ